MKRTVLLSLLFFVSFFAATAQVNHVVISQVFGGGGNSGALFKNDFVELYNPTNNVVNLSGWSLQYAGATSSNWNSNKVTLSGSIAPGKYFLIQLKGDDAGAGNNLPAPDLASNNIIMSATSGKVALVNDHNTLSGNCPSFTSIIDLVGYGSADCSEGSKASATTTATALFRKDNGCTDTDNNSADFYTQAPSPRNSQSPGHQCSNSISVTSVAPLPFCVDAVTAASGVVQFTSAGTFNTTFKAYLTDVNGSYTNKVLIGTTTVSGTNPSGSIPVTIPANSTSGTNYFIRIDAEMPSTYGVQGNAVEIINGAKDISSVVSSPYTNQLTLNWSNPSGCFDEIMIVCKEGAAVSLSPSGDGSNYTADLNFQGAGSEFDGGKVVYKGTTSGQTITGLTTGATYHFKFFTRRGTNWSPGFPFSDKPRLMPLPGDILINQFSPGYNGASYEYIELVNTTNKTFDLSELSYSYQDQRGDGRPSKGLSGILQPNSFWLLASSSSVTAGRTTNLSSDGSTGSGISANGHIAITRKTDGIVLDAVAYGNVSGGTYIEGSAAPTPPANGGLRRLTDGLDNNNNATDFVPVANADIDLRNSTSRLANNQAIIGSGTYTRLYVTGNSSLNGPITLTEKLEFGSGIFSLNDHNLSTPAITNGAASRYVRTNGTGSLLMKNIGSAAVFIPVGNSTYNPLTIQNGSGLDWSIRLQDGVDAVHGGKAILRTWHITPSATPTEGASLTFHYNDGDPAQTGPSFLTTEDVQVWTKHNGSWQKAGDPQPPTGTPNGFRTATLSGWTQFSPFVVASASAVLPVTFGLVKAYKQGAGVVVEWTNQTEEDIATYQVERSADGRQFLPLATVHPLKNDGSAATYRFTDKQPLSGLAYYRIRAQETSLRTVYSPVVRLSVQASGSLLAVLPNPVTGRQVNFSVTHAPAGVYRFVLYNAAGQAVHRQVLRHSGGSFVQAWELPHLKSGYYVLQISGAVHMQSAVVVQ